MVAKKNIIYRNAVVYVIGINLLLFLFLPFYASWSPAMSEVLEGGWIQICLYEDEFLLMGLSPFYLIFPLMLLSKNRIVKMALKGVLLILASFYFAYGVVATGMPVQDFVPRMGVYLLIPLLPELVYLYYLDSWLKENKKRD